MRQEKEEKDDGEKNEINLYTRLNFKLNLRRSEPKEGGKIKSGRPRNHT